MRVADVCSFSEECICFVEEKDCLRVFCFGEDFFEVFFCFTYVFGDYCGEVYTEDIFVDFFAYEGCG